MSKPRDDRHRDLFRPALDEIIDLDHPLVQLSRRVDWNRLDAHFGAVCSVGPGKPPLASRLVAGLLMLKHMHELSDEALCTRWLENPYDQFFCGEQFFRRRLPFDRSSLARWRRRLGEEDLATLIEESLAAAGASAAPAGGDPADTTTNTALS